MENDLQINTIIIEDNIESQEYLTAVLNKNFKDINILGYAKSIAKAVNLIKKEKPELIFMDIELTDGLCFSIFEQIDNHDFEIIFITAFDNYIQKAIDHFAFSYIMKPIESSKLINSVAHYVNLKERLFTINKFQHLSSFLNQTNAHLLIQVGHDHISVAINNITKCKANGNFTWFHLNNGKSFLASKSLKYYYKLLATKGFFKAHRSILINIKYIQSIYKKETIILKNGDKVHVSVRNKSKLSDLISVLS